VARIIEGMNGAAGGAPVDVQPAGVED
jgi:hypothetical protein